MITLHSFTEAHRSWTRGQIPFRLLQDQAAVLWAYVDVPPSVIPSNPTPSGPTPPFELPSDPFLITGEQIDALLVLDVAEAMYADLLGGDVHVCETDADLLSVAGMDMEFAEQHGRWPHVAELPMAWDSCAYVVEPPAEPQWVLFLLCWNDAGGSVFYVPKHLWTAARVAEHMALSTEVWQGAT